MPNAKLMRCSVYPQFEVLQDGKTHLVSDRCAARLLSEGGTLGKTVHDCDNTSHKLTKEEKKEIKTLTQEWTTTP